MSYGHPIDSMRRTLISVMKRLSELEKAVKVIQEWKNYQESVELERR